MTATVIGTEVVNPADLTPHPRNPNRGDTAAIAESLTEHGQYRSVVVNQDGMILAGHHVVQAAVSLGWEQVRIERIECDEATADKILLADNRIAELGDGLDPEQLLAILTDLDTLTGTGYDDDYLDDLVELINSSDELISDDTDDDNSDSDRAPNPGELLQLLDVTVADPEFKPDQGTAWKLGHHTLVVARVTDQHHLWSEYLTGGVEFSPYPNPSLTLTDRARNTPMLLVQPNRMMAGILFELHEKAFGDKPEQIK